MQVLILYLPFIHNIDAYTCTHNHTDRHPYYDGPEKAEINWTDVLKGSDKPLCT